MTITQARRDELCKRLTLVQKKLDVFEAYAYPTNRRLVRQFIGLREFGLKYLLFVLTRIGLVPRWEFHVRLLWGKEIVLPIDRTTTEINYLGTLPETSLTSFLIKNFKNDDVLYDVGASYGFYTLLAAEFVTAGSIHCFEPSSLAFPYLKKNTDTVPSVTLNNVLVWREQGEMPFFHAKGFTTMSTTIPGVVEEGAVQYTKVMLPVITLDEYVRLHPVPTVIKMDIEGGEGVALEGAKELLKKYSPMVIIEVWDGDRGNKFSMPAVKFLRGLGYRAHHIFPDGSLRAEDREDLTATKPCGNFAFMK